MLLEIVLVSILTFIGLLIILFAIKSTYPETTNYSLVGGSSSVRKFIVPPDAEPLVSNEGVFSCCYIDKKHNKFYKIYIEPRDDYYYKQKRVEVIGDKLITSHFLREFEIMNYMYKRLPLAGSPKIYTDESSEIEFDEELFKKIRSSVHHKPEDIVMRCLVMEYLPFQTLSTFFKNNGFNCSEDGRSLVSNDMNKDLLIKLYNEVFNKLIIMLEHKVIPYDFENASNILISDKTLMIHLIDCTAYNIIDSKETDYTIDDLFLYYIHEVICLQRTRIGRQVFNPLLTHPDKVEIANESLKGRIKQETINKFCSDLLDDNERKYQLLKDYVVRCLLGDNDSKHLNMLNLLNLFMNNKNELERMKQKVETICSKNGYTNEYLKSIRINDAEHIKLFKFMKQNKFSDVEFEYVVSIVTNQEVEQFYDKLIQVINHYKQPTEHMFFINPLVPIIGYDNSSSKHKKPITTNNYLKLTTYSATVSTKASFVSGIKTETFLAAFLPNKRSIVETMYLIIINEHN